jgi:hypothetical protein
MDRRRIKKIRKLLWINSRREGPVGPTSPLARASPYRRPKSKKGSLIREDDGVAVALCCCRHCHNYSSCDGEWARKEGMVAVPIKGEVPSGGGASFKGPA